jgi:putative endonuclease
MKSSAVYILASKRNGTLYTGVTSDLVGRVWQHKNHVFEGFTKKYGVTTLVYFEWFESISAAIEREKQIKSGSRAKKLALIENQNPEWRDLYFDLIEQ